MWASDYPHWDSDFPNSVKQVLADPAVSGPDKEAILHTNALRLFGWAAA